MEEKIYSFNLFMNSVLPLFRVIALDMGLESKKFIKESVIQISCLTEEGKKAIHFTIEDRNMTTALGEHESPSVELEFSSIDHFNAFFKGTTKKMPKIRGMFTHMGIFVFTMKVLLRMSKLLSMTTAPETEKEKRLLCKLLFYLLSSGISQLNKLGHPAVKKWTGKSPRRVYAYTIDGHEDVAAYIMIEKGKSKSRRGRYTRSKPFFAMRFVDLDSALAVLQETGDTLELTKQEKLIMEGAPEFGGKLGDLMELVGSYVK